MISSTHQAILSKAQKLRAMTQGAGASEAEAAMAAQVLARLIAEHSITETELSVRQDAKGYAFTEYDLFVPDDGVFMLLLRGIARAYHCRFHFRQRKEDLLELGFPQKFIRFSIFGAELDREATVGLFHICYLAVATETESYSKTLGRVKGKVQSLRDFQVGMIERLTARITPTHSQAPTTGTALLVLKDQLVTDAYAQALRAKGIRLRQATGPRVSSSSSAYSAGQSAGSRVDLGGKKLSSQRLLPN